MTTQERNQIRNLLPDLMPADHVSLNTKRINFIYGQGVIIYDKTFAVEVYLPRNPKEDMTFFAVQRHFGNVNGLGEYYRRMDVKGYSDPCTTSEMKRQFDEALFHHISMEIAQKNYSVTALPSENVQEPTPVMDLGSKDRMNKVA